ncbi:hypothetical protein LPB140_03060 [Sphingorhabdus lutea]|uniref:BD-FAE-like domain-containing protein n=2 Tax=Sphingorhabdus lutea TaxID=1913578 RepID=A0A1L3JEE6_9SPHN|nr:hypothetical protein LPB140_03060 [Sphingorhabdus lutea]
MASFHLPAYAQIDDHVHNIISLWQGGVPGFESRAETHEFAKDYYVKNIHNPSLTLYRPVNGTANGSAVIILPGGGHEKLVINSEGRDAAIFMAQRGYSAFVLKYRLFREENSPYIMEDARADTERAVRLLRHRAKEFGIQADKIGIMAFSAGGELARQALFSPPVAARGKGDMIDSYSSIPDFGILVYPGPLKGDVEIINADAPPLFMVAANDDICCSAPIIDLLSAYNSAHAPAEAHIYAMGGHAFNMGQRTKVQNLAKWTDRLTEWLEQLDEINAQRR